MYVYNYDTIGPTCFISIHSLRIADRTHATSYPVMTLSAIQVSGKDLRMVITGLLVGVWVLPAEYLGRGGPGGPGNPREGDPGGPGISP